METTKSRFSNLLSSASGLGQSVPEVKSLLSENLQALDQAS